MVWTIREKDLTWCISEVDANGNLSPHSLTPLYEQGHARDARDRIIFQVDVPEVGNEETDQEAAKERIWQALKQKGSLRVVEGRGLEKGDLAIIDFEARRADTGEAIAGSEKKGMQVDTMDDNAIFAIEGKAKTLSITSHYVIKTVLVSREMLNTAELAP